jgi:hypothetical protein
VLPLGSRAALLTFRVSTGLEADLHAIGADAERIAGEVNEIQDEFTKRVGELRERFQA